MEILKELLFFMKSKKKLWLLPLLSILLALGAIIIFAEGSVLAPFIYTLF